MTSEFSISEAAISDSELGAPASAPRESVYEQLVNKYAGSLAKYLPNDELFSAKYIHDSNLRGLLRGIGRAIIRGDAFIDELKKEFIPDNTTLFLGEWERLLGIPDNCFSGVGNISDRRTAILIKLAAMGVQTNEDFVALAAMLGIAVIIYPGKDVYDDPGLVPGLDVGTDRQARYTIVVTYSLPAGAAFTYTFPIPFGTSEVALLQCIFDDVKPANCRVIYQNV